MDWPLSREEQKRHVMRLYDKDVRAANHLLHSGEFALKSLRAELKAARTSSSSSKRQEGHQAAENSKMSSEAIAIDAKYVPCGTALLESSPIVSEPETECLDENDATEEKSLANCADSGYDLLVTPPSMPKKRKCQEAKPEKTLAAEDAAEAAERLQHAIVDAAAALAALLGTSSMPSVLAGIAQDVSANMPDEESEEEGGAGVCLVAGGVRPRARSEGAARVAAPALVRGDRRRRSRGGEKFRVSFADNGTSEPAPKEDVTPRINDRRASIEEPEPGPPDSSMSDDERHMPRHSEKADAVQVIRDVPLASPNSSPQLLPHALPQGSPSSKGISSICRRRGGPLVDVRKSASRRMPTLQPSAGPSSSAPTGMLDFL